MASRRDNKYPAMPRRPSAPRVTLIEAHEVDDKVLTADKVSVSNPNRILGRDSSLDSVAIELTVSGGIEFAAGGIRRGALTGDVISSPGSTATNISPGVVADSHISASAGIQRSKLAAGTANQVVVNDSTGALSGVSPGSSGNVLTSDGTKWVSQAASGGLPTASNTGDLVRWSGSAWAAARPGGSHSTPFRTGSAFDAYYPQPGIVSSSTSTISTDALRGDKWPATYSGVLDRLGVFVTTGSATAKMRLGIFAMGANGYPGTRLWDSGEILPTTSSTLYYGNPNLSVVAGAEYWFVVILGTASPSFTTKGPTSVPLWWTSGGLTVHGITVAQPYGALPASYPTGASVLTGAINFPVFFTRYA